MFAQREDSGLWGEGPVLVGEHDGGGALEGFVERSRFAGENDLRGAQALEFREQRGFALDLGGLEVAGREINQRKPD